jgi:hypothetical protein
MKLEELQKTIQSKAAVFGEQIAREAVAAIVGQFASLVPQPAVTNKPSVKKKVKAGARGRKAAPLTQCSVPGCGAFAKVKGLCINHYQKSRRDQKAKAADNGETAPTATA